jgi:hypothetical protein
MPKSPPTPSATTIYAPGGNPGDAVDIQGYPAARLPGFRNPS